MTIVDTPLPMTFCRFRGAVPKDRRRGIQIDCHDRDEFTAGRLRTPSKKYSSSGQTGDRRPRVRSRTASNLTRSRPNCGAESYVNRTLGVPT
jgi:hypothetical protein